MRNKFNQFILERKQDIRDNGLFFCLFVWVFICLIFLLISPFLLIGLFFVWINDCSKKWFGGSS